MKNKDHWLHQLSKKFLKESFNISWNWFFFVLLIYQLFGYLLFGQNQTEIVDKMGELHFAEIVDYHFLKNSKNIWTKSLYSARHILYNMVARDWWVHIAKISFLTTLIKYITYEHYEVEVIELNKMHGLWTLSRGCNWYLKTF